MPRRFPFIISLAVAIALTFNVAASRVQSQQQAPAAVVSKPPVTIPFELANKHIILKVKVDNSRPLSFILDTGDKYAILNLDRARELGLKMAGEVRVGGAGAGTSTGAFVRDSNFTVVGLNDFSQPLNMALPIGRMASKLGQDFDGIIGHDFISQFVVEIDYEARILKLHDNSTFNYTGNGASVPISINGAGHPIVEAIVTPVSGEPISGKFVVDIGSGLALALHSPTVNKYKLLNPNSKTIRAAGAGGAGGSVKGELGRVAQLQLANFKIDQPITLFAQDTAGAFSNSELVGNIGAQVMNRFRVFLDYGRDRIILEPTSRLSNPYDRAFTGLSIYAEGPNYRTFRVGDVLDNSPAAELGIKIDDVIVSIDGKPTAELTLTQLNELLEKTSAYAIELKRGEQVVKVKLTPRRLI